MTKMNNSAITTTMEPETADLMSNNRMMLANAVDIHQDKQEEEPAPADELLPEEEMTGMAQQGLDAPMAPEPEPAVKEDTPDNDDAPAATGAANNTSATMPKSVPPTQADDEKKQQYWRSVLTGDPVTVPDAVRAQSGVDEWEEATEEQKEYRLLSTVNKSWAADHLPLSREKIHAEWREQRAGLTRKLGVQDNEHELFIALSQEAEDAPRREAAEKIYETYYMAGLDGRAPDTDSSPMQNLSPTDERNAGQLAEAAYLQGKKKREELMTLAKSISSGMDAFAAIEDDTLSAPRVLAAAPDLLSSIDTLAEMSENDVNTTLYLAAALTRKQNPDADASGLLSRMIASVRRGTTHIGMGALQTLSHTGIAMLNRMGNQFGSKSLSSFAAGWDKRMQMLHKISKLSQNELRPLVLPEERHNAASYLITAAEAAPAALLSCCGGAGFAALTLGAVGNSVAEARDRAPMASQELQLYAGLLAGAIQAGIYMNLNRVGGRLLEQSISRIGRASGQGLSGYTLAGLNVMGNTTVEAAKLLAAGKLAMATDLGAQEMAARLSNTASNIDWESFGSNLTDIEANMHEAAALLPFLLLGSGRLALEHFRSPRAIIGDGNMLNDWGIPKQQQELILAETDLARQSRMLHDAVAGSKRWSGIGFLPAAWRAMRLLHSDSFHEFKEVNQIHDFLQLPPENRALPAPKQTGKTPYDPASAAGNRAEAMKLFNEWWSLADIEHSPEAYPNSGKVFSNTRSTPTERSTEAYIALERFYDPQLPERMREQGVYAPNAERERRIMMYDRVSDLHRLSYQFLMNIYSVDALANDWESAKSVRSKTERTRYGLLGAVARAVVSTASGVSRDDALQGLDKYVSEFFTRRKYKGIRADWMKQMRFLTLSSIPDMADFHPSTLFDNNPELLDAFRMTTGLRANTNALMDILPHTMDFQTALTRGLSPAEAYSLILKRELGIPDKILHAGNIRTGIDIRNVTPMQAYTEQNAKRFDIYRQMTGYDVEHSTGEDSTVYTRVRRPDGSYTHWHEHDNFAVNDVAGNASLTFLPFRHNLDMQKSITSAEGDTVNLLNRPLAEEGVFSAYDQLCSVARHDLGALWVSNATRVQPGMFQEYARRYFRSGIVDDGVTPHIREPKDGDETYNVDVYSDVTPLSLAQSRFYIYWKRMIHSGFITPEQIGEFLVEQGYMEPQAVDGILNPPRARVNYRNRHKRNALKEAIEARSAGILHNIAQTIADYTTLSFLAKLPQLPMPKSVKEWYAMAAFCPEPDREVVRDSIGRAAHRVAVKNDGTGLINWANRLVAKKMRDMAPQVDEMRKRQADKSKTNVVFDSLILDAMGLDTYHNCEQGWCYHHGGAPMVHGVSQSYWNLLRHPRIGWENMEETAREDLRKYLDEFCRCDPLFTQTDNPEIDHVTHAMHVLDDLLREYPEMHRYAVMGGTESQVRRLDFRDDVRDVALGEEPLYEPKPLYTHEPMSPGCKISTMSEPPDFITYDARVRSGLELLDMLRVYPTHMPYAYRDSIWWNGELYGLGGKTPDGLEGEYLAERPLEPLLQLLRAVHDYEEEHGPLTICGVRVAGIGDELNLSPLQAITIYRSKIDRGYMYRLMPGDPTLENSALRSPYLVHCRNGVYLNNRVAVRDATEMGNVCLPLHSFHPQPYRLYQRHGDTWASAAYIYNMEQTLRHCSGNYGPDRQHPAYMLEYLMRLTEDSGLSLSLTALDPASLSVGQARLLNMARDILMYLYSPESQEASKRLKGYAETYNTLSKKEPLTKALKQANENIPGRDGHVFRLIEEELNKALDAMDNAHKIKNTDTEQ